MRLLRPSLLIVSLVCVLIACASIEPLTENDLQQARKTFSDVTLEQLHEGRQLYTRKCGTCHYLYPRERFTMEKWKHEIADMMKKAKITQAEGTRIEQYLSSGAKTDL